MLILLMNLLFSYALLTQLHLFLTIHINYNISFTPAKSLTIVMLWQ